jgi:hypothetical protein
VTAQDFFVLMFVIIVIPADRRELSSLKIPMIFCMEWTDSYPDVTVSEWQKKQRGVFGRWTKFILHPVRTLYFLIWNAWHSFRHRKQSSRQKIAVYFTVPEDGWVMCMSLANWVVWRFSSCISHLNSSKHNILTQYVGVSAML